MLKLILLAQLAVVADRDITFAWDYPEISAGVVDEFRVYVSKDVTDFDDLTQISPALTVAVPDLQGQVLGVGPGQWYAVATAYDLESDQESPQSSLFPFFVLGSPINFRVIP